MLCTAFRRFNSNAIPLVARMATSSEKIKTLEEILPDFPNGPLTPYRKLASFDWRTLMLTIDDEETIRYKDKIWSFFKNNELFHNSPASLNLEDQRYQTVKRMQAMKSNGCLLDAQTMLGNPSMLASWGEALFSYDPDSAVKLSLTYSLFSSVIQSLGTSKHYKYIEAAENEEIFGCFALTEVAHGSNAKGMRTTATFDNKTKEFIVDSPDFESAKCWVGCLGQCATHAIVYAKLITSSGKNEGLHAFVVPIRCTRSLRPFPGVLVGDIGEKIALNGVDNGFVMFNKYRISKDCLLNKLADIDDNGDYVSPIRDPAKRFGASLGVLSSGRVQITGMASTYLLKAVTIAIRYSAVRRQFGPDDSNEELSVIEYQQQQFRLIPYIAVIYASRIFFKSLTEKYVLFVMDSTLGALKGEEGSLKGMEIHAISSAVKPITGWIARDGIQVCREACGGHGYLQVAGLGKLRNENDANCTYEGENSLLIQQTSNWLLSLLNNLKKGTKVNTLYNSANYLNDMDEILKSKAKITTTAEATDPKVLLNAYKWLVCYLLKLTSEKATKLSKEGLDSFNVRNNIQSYNATVLSAVYIEHVILDSFHDYTLNAKDESCKKVMMKLVSLYGAWSLEKHLANLYMGGYFSDNSGHLLRDGVVELCKLLKSEAVALVDAMAPPDFILNSVLGKSDGHVYQNLQSAIFSYPGALSRPNWWRELIKWDSSVPSKL